MHIGEGVLTATRAGQGVLLAGTVAAAAGTMIGTLYFSASLATALEQAEV